MSMRWLTLLCVILLVSGCHTPPMQNIDQSVSDLVSHPLDVAPAHARKPVDAGPTAPAAAGCRARRCSRRRFCRARRWACRPPARLRARMRRVRCRRASRLLRPPLVRHRVPEPTAGPVCVPATIRQRRADDILYSSRRGHPEPGSVTDQEVRADDSQGGSGVGDAAGRLSDRRGKSGPRRSRGSFPNCPRCPKSLWRSRARTAAPTHWQTSTGWRPPTVRPCARRPPTSRRPEGFMKQSVTYPNPTIGYETNPNNNNTGSATRGSSSIR